jgi:altronate dehydratase large subunit
MTPEVDLFPRTHGRPGVRNHVVILSVMDNTNAIARRIASSVRFTRAICPHFGRGLVGEDLAQHKRTLIGLGSNPNVYGAVIIGLEATMTHEVADRIAENGRPAAAVVLDEVGSSISATEVGVRAARDLVIEASAKSTTKGGFENLLVGVECGGSDGTSGVTTNPAIGLFADTVVRHGGSVLMSETVEWMGAEHLLMKRAVDARTSERIHDAVHWYEVYAKTVGISISDSNPTPDNSRGGLTTIEEKSLGAIMKGGSAPIKELVPYAQAPTEAGLMLMDAPPPGVENITGLAAAGCQLILFSTGKGNPIGCPVVPTIKICANPHTVSIAADHIDVDLSALISRGEPLAWGADRIRDAVSAIASGTLTAAEVLGEEEIAITRIGFSI